nr:MAG TPA: hypothetical protein [Caudoviricetes sp.]
MWTLGLVPIRLVLLPDLASGCCLRPCQPDLI